MAVPLLLIIFEKRQQNINSEKRKDQLLADFPGLISKFSLLNLAGLSINNALQKLAEDYQKNLSTYGKQKYAYEELINTCQKIKNGMYEAFAYEEMGRRYELPCYIKFSSLLISGLKRGNADFNRHLAEEVTTSLLEHKADILQKSSKLSTKLLGPMMIIFTVILILIMVPAFLSMNL